MQIRYVAESSKRTARHRLLFAKRIHRTAIDPAESSANNYGMTPFVWLTLLLQVAIGVVPQVSLRCVTCSVDTCVTTAAPAKCCHECAGTSESQLPTPSPSSCQCEAFPVANLVKNEIELRSPLADFAHFTAVDVPLLDRTAGSVLELADAEVSSVSRQILFCTWLK
ncbi:MAG: hypothetical protein SGJ20_01780 [Planctomycetota bacterium]|nr:hypothetical protein [Planctomycetota bacterium]